MKIHIEYSGKLTPSKKKKLIALAIKKFLEAEKSKK